MGVTRIVVHIDRLILRGVPSTSRQAIGDALRNELARALAVPDAVARATMLGSRARLRATLRGATLTDTARALGCATGRAVAAELLGPGRSAPAR